VNSLSIVAKHSPVALEVHAASSPGSGAFKVMCATDLWARSDAALQKALWLAEVSDAQLLLLHVVDGELPLRIAGRKADLARGALEWRLREKSAFRVRPAVSVRIGNPQRTIVRVARDWRADLVVLGAPSARVADRLLGTTAERVADEGRCAALVVNGTEAGPYSSAGVIAASCCKAAALEDAVDKLQILRGGAPVTKVYPLHARRRIWKSPDRHAAEAMLSAPPAVVISEVDRWPGVCELLRRGVSGLVARSGRADVLIAPRRSQSPEATVRCKCEVSQYPAKSSRRMSSSSMPRLLTIECKPATICGGPAM
jgi:nucleotide-binding universal stress UspA family protein